MVKNEAYRKFIDKGIIDIITKDQLKAALKNIPYKYNREGRALLITLFYTGARPVEALGLKGKDITMFKGYYVAVRLETAKKGKTRTLMLLHKDPLVRELYDYAIRCFPEALLFYHYRSEYTRKTKSKFGKDLERKEVSDKLRYHIKKWFKGVIPESITTYFLRHNRFSSLAQEGVSPQDIKEFKGAKSITSVDPYIHLSTKKLTELARRIK